MTESVLIDKEVAKIVEKLEEVKSFGHGELRIIVKNGSVYRIIIQKDELV